MTIAEVCVFLAVLLYLLTLAPAKVFGHRAFDNANPRAPGFYRDPIRARLLGAHNNGVETFPFFLGAVLLAEFRGGKQPLLDALAISFLILRLAFVIAYVSGRSTTRTLLWSAGFVVNAAIFFLPAYGR